MTKLNKDKFIPLFGDWWEKIEPFFNQGGLDPIYEQLKKDSSSGKKIAPISNNVFRAFTCTPLKSLQMVIAGMCPYHSLSEGTIIADGLLMGCSITNKLQPSLLQFYNAVEKEIYGISLDGFKNPDVEFIACQGVLMYNVALTTQINVAGSHLKLWEPFSTYLFKEVLSVEKVPIIFLGKDAAKYKEYTTGNKNVFELSHPASASYKNEQWDTKGVFKEAIEIVKGITKKEIELLDFVPF